MRIILSSSPNTGMPRLLTPLIESCASKTAVVKAYSLDYIALAAAIWKAPSVFDK